MHVFLLTQLRKFYKVAVQADGIRQDMCMWSRSVEKLRVVALEALHSVGINMADNRLTIRHWKGKE